MMWYIVLPSLKVSGGVHEAIRLCSDFARSGAGSALVCIWRTDRAVATDLAIHQLSDKSPRAKDAIVDLPLSFLRFRRWLKSQPPTHGANFVFTHYSTFPLALLVPRRHRFYFVQDLEWHFLGFAPASWLLKKIILYFYRHGRPLAANSYLDTSLRQLHVPIESEVPIWANADFTMSSEVPRDLDFAMVLRKGAHKRLDLYLSFIEMARKAGWRIAVISPEEEIIEQVRSQVTASLLCPTLAEMRDIYARSQCFLHLSEHEGFGLPPLEAMAAGCVPLCRDSGGVRAFMYVEPLPRLLLSRELSIEAIFSKAQALLGAEELPQLSAASRKIFRQGLEKVRNRSTELARLQL